MRVESLLEIIEPQVRSKNWRGSFDTNKLRNISSDDEIDSGNFSTAKSIRNNPHMIRKTSNNPYRASIDAYWEFVKEVIDSKLWENPYFPRLYDITKVTDNEGNYMYRAKMERLEELPRDKDEFKSMMRKVIGDHVDSIDAFNSNYKYNKSHEVVSDNIEQFVEEGNFQEEFSNIPNKDIDQKFKEALKILRSLSKEKGWRVDILVDNLMARRGPQGMQLVLADPYSFKKN